MRCLVRSHLAHGPRVCKLLDGTQERPEDGGGVDEQRGAQALGHVLGEGGEGGSAGRELESVFHTEAIEVNDPDPLGMKTQLVGETPCVLQGVDHVSHSNVPVVGFGPACTRIYHEPLVFIKTNREEAMHKRISIAYGAVQHFRNVCISPGEGFQQILFRSLKVSVSCCGIPPECLFGAELSTQL